MSVNNLKNSEIKATSEWELNESKIDFGCFATIRFAASHGNTVALADMSREPKLWLTDLDGKIR